MAPAPLPSLGLILGPGYSVAAGAASFTLAGQDVGLLLNTTVASASAAAPLPSLATLLEPVPNKVLACGPGAFVLEVAPSLSDFALTCEPGSVTLVGQDVALGYGRARLICEPAAYTLTGQFVALRGPGETRLICEAGSFAITGTDVPLKAARTLAAEPAAYAAAGQPTTFVRGLRLVAATGAYSVAGQPANLTRTGGVTRYGRRGRRSSGTFPTRTNTVF